MAIIIILEGNVIVNQNYGRVTLNGHYEIPFKLFSVLMHWIIYIYMTIQQ